jgi:hypothetical protein
LSSSPVRVIWLAIFGGPDGPAATFGAPDGIAVGCDEGFEATAGFEERPLCALRLTAWLGFADRCGASTVIAGNVGGLAEEFVGSVRAGLVASEPDCAWAEAVYSNPGISAAVKAS